MDGAFYNDLRAPFISADIASVTLGAANKALYPVANFPVLGGNYFSFIGKAMHIRLFGRMTTGVTPGNLTIAVYYGSGVDATGTIIASSAAFALTASQTSLSWAAELDVHCRSIGATGTLFCTGWFEANPAVVASTLQPIMIPANLAAASSGVDLTASNIISVQALRSGSTGESMQIHNMQVIALN